MPERTRGFTLIELLVVVLIIGVLAAIAIPQYSKSVEYSRADDAASTVQMIGTTNRMFFLDFSYYAAGGSATGFIDNNCAGACGAGPPNNQTDGCELINCHYLATQNWAAKYWDFSASSLGTCPGVTGTNMVACAQRSNRSPSSGSSCWAFGVTNTGQTVQGSGNCAWPQPQPPS